MNSVYDSALEGFLDGSIDWDSDTIKLALVSAGYTPDFVTDRFLSALGAAVVARSPALTSKTATGGAADADDVTFPTVSGAEVTQYVVYQDTGDDATSRLICRIDTAAGLPVTPNGGDIKVTFDSGANRIFKL